MDNEPLPTSEDAGSQSPLSSMFRRHRWLWIAALVVAIVKTVPPVSDAVAVPVSDPGAAVVSVPASGATANTLEPSPVSEPPAPDAFPQTVQTPTVPQSSPSEPQVWPTSPTYGGTGSASPSPTPSSTPDPLSSLLPICVGTYCFPPRLMTMDSPVATPSSACREEQTGAPGSGRFMSSVALDIVVAPSTVVHHFVCSSTTAYSPADYVTSSQ